jgi:hypothetical protein
MGAGAVGANSSQVNLDPSSSPPFELGAFVRIDGDKLEVDTDNWAASDAREILQGKWSLDCRISHAVINRLCVLVRAQSISSHVNRGITNR